VSNKTNTTNHAEIEKTPTKKTRRMETNPGERGDREPTYNNKRQQQTTQQIQQQIQQQQNKQTEHHQPEKEKRPPKKARRTETKPGERKQSQENGETGPFSLLLLLRLPVPGTMGYYNKVGTPLRFRA